MLLELVLRRLVELIDAVAFDVEFPAVIDAAQPAFLVAPEEQRDAAMRAEFVDQADAAVAVAERDEILAEQSDAHRRAVRLGSSQDRQAGIQYRRIALPIGVPGPTRVTSSFSSVSASAISFWLAPGIPVAARGHGAAISTPA